MKRLLFGLGLWLAAACGASAATCPPNGLPCTNVVPTDGAGNVVVGPYVATTWQATMTLAAATNATLVDGNVTKAPNSAATPASFGLVTVLNTGSAATNVCQFGGTCTSGGATLASGACDTYNISPASVPTFYSTGGTTLSLRNGGGC